MSLWWYVHKDKKTGPVAVDELRRLLQAGNISSKTMVWQEGMATWQPLDEVGTLSALKETLPPPLPSKADPDPLSYPFATRWSRLFARLFDVWWEVLLLAFLSGLVLNRYSAGFVEWINRPGSGQLFGLICLPFGMILDAVVYRVFGNTPGKALLRLKVTTLRGEPLGLTQYLQRNFSVWASGLALGIPIVNLFTFAIQSRRLGKGEQTSYDETTGFRVRSAPSGFLLKAIFGLAFASLFGVMATLNAIEQEAVRAALPSTSATTYSWENPQTRRAITVDSRWKHSVQLNEDRQTIYHFSELTNHAIVNLGVEQAPSFTLDDYIRAFQKSTSAHMRFSDGGRFFERDGHQAWQGAGSMAADTSIRLSVQIVQTDSGFWRVVAIQAMPYDYSDLLVRHLQTSLWDTVR